MPADPAPLSGPLRAAVDRYLQTASANSLAVKADVWPQTLSRWLSGERDLALSTADKIGSVVLSPLQDGAKKKSGKTSRKVGLDS